LLTATGEVSKLTRRPSTTGAKPNVVGSDGKTEAAAVMAMGTVAVEEAANGAAKRPTIKMGAVRAPMQVEAIILAMAKSEVGTRGKGNGPPVAAATVRSG
jgi:hypothetical protein